MKKTVTDCIWVVKIAYDYSWATIYCTYQSLDKAVKDCDLDEGDYEGFKVRWLRKGESLPEVGIIYG